MITKRTLKSWGAAMPCMAAVLTTACGGGGGGGPPPVTTYTVTATAGANGTVSPGSATVNAGGTTTFTVTPNTNYNIGSVTGCGGTLSGNIYTTGAVSANCTVTANFSIVTYAVTATAGTDGSISPSTATVALGGTTTFTVTANSGHIVSSVTGCGGSLSGNTYTTGTISAACTVTASFSAAFTWISGSSTSDATGVYGALGDAAAANVPGGRDGPATWTDTTGNLWLFGGYGVGSDIFSDVWKYSPATGLWTWVAGSNSTDAAAVLGTQGTAAATNTPGAEGAGFTWTDSSGNFWLFGGYGYDSTGTRGWLNALWEFSPTSGQWTWQGGSATVNALPVYGTLGVAAATNFPGARATGGWAGWQDASGNIWIFGEYGPDSTGTLGRLNDLWRYSPATGLWTWVGGSNIANTPGVYGTQGVAASTNMPGARGAFASWTDKSGNFWIFGGTGFDSANQQGILNDLWEYSPATGLWTWVGGSSTRLATGVYGTQGVAAAANIPGARDGAAAWSDAAGNLWLLGGYGLDSTGAANEENDLWEYSIANNQWTWVAGSNTGNAQGVYGTQGVAAATNVPGSRDSFVTWSTGSLVWLFGGEGYNSTGADPNAPKWNDLWTYPIQ